MKTLLTAILVSLLMVTGIPAFAAPPATITYQGYITDSNNAPLNVPIAMTLSLYSDLAGGVPLWSEHQPGVPVVNGIYSVLMGSLTPINLSFNTVYYLGVAVGSDPEMTPRQELSAVPYSFRASSADKLNQVCGDGEILTFSSASAKWSCTSLAAITGLQGGQGQTGLTGLQGSQGIPGTQGVQGIQGVAGTSGSNGLDGKTVLNGTIDPVDANDGVNGDFFINSASNKIFGPKASGTWPAGVTLVGPQGVAGATGATGSQGIQGIQGVAGTAGATGAQGIQGNTGATGAAGTTGAQGIQGVAGTNGSNGLDGKTVLNGVIDPVNATDGVNGDFFINTASNKIFGPKAAGFWPAGVALVGPSGPTGAAGTTGAVGPAGTQGIQGIQGVAGTNGTNGADGATGPQGPIGASPFTLNGTDVYYTAGNLGIGTTTPTSSIEIKQPFASLGLTWTDTTIGGGIGFNEGTTWYGTLQAIGSTSAAVARRYGVELSAGANNNGFLSFRTVSGSTESERVRIANNGNVGIGTTSPGALLSFGGNANAQQLHLYSGQTGNPDANSRYGFGIGSSEMRTFVPDNGILTFGNIATSDATTYTEKMRMTGAGDFGIGKSPVYKLDVAGDVNVSTGSKFLINGVALNFSDLAGTPTIASGSIANSDVSGTAAIATSKLSGPVTSIASHGLATVATSGSYSDLANLPTLGTAAALNVGTAASNIVQLDATTGKLPAVDGSLLTNVSATIGSDGNANTKAGFNTLNALTTGLMNSAFGSGSLQSVTTGNGNSAFGELVLSSNVTGWGNSAFGGRALFNFTGGNYNVAVGQMALAQTTGGDANVAIGRTAGFNVAGDAWGAGTNNLLLGNSAGYTLTTGSDNVIIGASADVQAATDSNEIVIGKGAVGKGSNTTTIGNATTASAFVAGIKDVTLGGTTKTVVIDTTTGQLGAVSGGAAPSAATTVTTQAYSDGATVGTATTYAREDHKHAFPASAKDTTAATGILKGNGSAITAAIAADFPPLNQNTTGTAANVTGTVTVANGGTGATTLTGYVKGAGTSNLSASTTIPTTDITGLGTAAALNVGTAASNIVQLDGTSKLPAVDASQLTNVAINSDAQNNVKGGTSALSVNSGWQDTAFGHLALASNTTGQANTAVGYRSLSNAVITYSNTAFGSEALAYIGNNSNNTAIGYAAGAYAKAPYNVAVGWQALKGGGASTGDQNVAVGADSLLVFTTGSSNTVVGNSAAAALTSGSNNIVVGRSSGNLLTTGGRNILIGNAGVATESSTIRIGNATDHTKAYLSGIYGVTPAVASPKTVVIDSNGQLGSTSLGTVATLNTGIAAGNVVVLDAVTAKLPAVDGSQLTNISAVVLSDSTKSVKGGTSALAVNVGNNQAAFGHQALKANTSGTENAAFGYQALMANTTGYANTAIGTWALSANTYAGNNTAVGDGAAGNHTGGFNTAIGAGAVSGVYGLTAGWNNVGVGASALMLIESGGDNVAVGTSASQYLTTGSTNLVLGYNAAQILTTGSDNVIVGAAAEVKALDDANSIVIGKGAVGNGSNTTTIGNATTVQTFIAGISGVTPAVTASTKIVAIDGNGQLGTLATAGRFVAVPATSSVACTPGDFSAEAGFIYVCIATNSWVKSAAATW